MAPLLAPSKERRSSPLQFGQEENIAGHSIERGAYLFVLKIARVFRIPTSRNRMINCECMEFTVTGCYLEKY